MDVRVMGYHVHDDGSLEDQGIEQCSAEGSSEVFVSKDKMEIVQIYGCILLPPSLRQTTYHLVKESSLVASFLGQK